MSTNLTRGSVVLCLMACALNAQSASAQQRGPQGDTYASIAKLPDWSGVWVWPFAEFAAENERLRDPNAAESALLTPVATALRDAAMKEISSNGRGSSAAPRAGTCGVTTRIGMPSVMRYSFGLEFLFTPGRVTILLEQGSTMRRIYTDGRAHSVDAGPSRAGESIGHWEGDTLVVDTRSITPGVPIVPNVPTTNGTNVMERMRKLDATHLQIDTIIEDPVMLREPLRKTRVYERTNSGWFDQLCDSDRDGRDQEPDLTPPPVTR